MRGSLLDLVNVSTGKHFLPTGYCPNGLDRRRNGKNIPERWLHTQIRKIDLKWTRRVTLLLWMDFTDVYDGFHRCSG